MMSFNVSQQGPAHRGLINVAASAMALAVLAGSTAHAHDRVPPVPQSLQVPAGHSVFFSGHAIGTQNYICVPAGSGFAWTLFTPQATLFNGGDKQLMTHFLSPNPIGSGTQPTWQHSRDSSAIWASAYVPPSFDPPFVAPGAIPWLLLKVAAAQEGPTGGDTLTITTFIHRVNTSGGMAPSTGCASWENVGSKKFIPYEADYFFYTDASDKH